MSTLVSIIVPCYNQAKYLKESLSSVLNQSYTNWECIIVNDGSPDNVDEIAENWTQKDNRFKYVKKENGGLSSARNAGIKNCNGEFILPLDADDILDEMYLEKLVPILEEDKSLGIVSCYSKFFYGNKENIVHELKPEGTTYHALLFENVLIATSLFRKKCWDEVSGYDENMKNGFEDWEFWLAITSSGWKYKIVKQFLFYYRKQKKSMLINTLKNDRITNMEYVFEKHKDIYVKHFDNTKSYLFFLLDLYRKSEQKIKSSFEYKLAIVLGKPLRMLQKLFSK